jgi:Fe-S cluster biogenesis protein NfuA
MEPRLADLAATDQLRPRDLDVVYVATGGISRAAVQRYLSDQPAASTSLPVVATELTERICGCQHHDGGRTELVAADESAVHLRVAGACVHCPQIKYTMAVLEDAIRYRAPQAVDVTIDGTDLATRQEVPPGSQVTMAMLMRRTGMTFEDLDRELDRKPVLGDDDLVRLAERCLLRRRYAGRGAGAGIPGHGGLSHGRDGVSRAL